MEHYNRHASRYGAHELTADLVLWTGFFIIGYAAGLLRSGGVL